MCPWKALWSQDSNSTRNPKTNGPKTLIFSNLINRVGTFANYKSAKFYLDQNVTSFEALREPSHLYPCWTVPPGRCTVV